MTIYGLAWTFSVKLQHKKTLIQLTVSLETRPPEKLVMLNQSPILSDKGCKQSNIGPFMRPGMICAGGEEGKDSCQVRCLSTFCAMSN